MLNNTNMKLYVCLVMICLGLAGCANQQSATWTQATTAPAQDTGSYIQSLIVQKQYAFGVENAMYSYKTFNSASAKKIVQDYYKYAIDEYLARMRQQEDSLFYRSSYYANLDALKRLQSDLLQYKFISKEIVDTKRREIIYSKNLANNIENNFLNDLRSMNHARVETGVGELRDLEKEGYEVKPSTKQAYDEYVKALLAQNNSEILSSLTKANLLNTLHGELIVNRAGQITMQEPLIAIEMYKLGNQVFNTTKYNAEIKQIEDALTRRVHVIIQNNTPTIMFANEQKIDSKIKTSFSNMHKYVVLNSYSGQNLREALPTDVYNYYQTVGKQLDFIDPVHFVVVVSIDQLEVSRKEDAVKRERATWTSRDGSNLVINSRASSAYAEKISHFEYDLHTKNVVGKISAKLLLYDYTKNRIIKVKKLTDSNNKRVIWCNKLVAVGAKNRYPASYMPKQMEEKCLKVPVIIDEGAIIESLLDNVIVKSKAEVQPHLLPEASKR